MKDESLSPEGTYAIRFDVFEVRMSHWVEVPGIFRLADDALLFDLRGEVWSAGPIAWLSDSVVQLSVRRYPGRVSCELVLNLQVGRGVAICGTNRFEGALSALENWVRRQ
ncbi:hypothetical protein [Larkinella humicola]|uniref:Uncharacterized protein n=1 Tax=Larkinella humicola TaxID=2607654 RepID=A0A5N1JF03_9BACT|nr:hypothetical protein [Larkinella humicola]KAA9349309.1 hypothetical protein F0P93_23230 [Larkinella humicola]